MMIIKDPQNLLDLNSITDSDKDCLHGMILDIPSHGVPLHPASIKRIIEAAKEGQHLLLLQPKLPVASDIGLSPYPIIAYLYPQNLSQQLVPFFHKLAMFSRGSVSVPPIFTVIDQTDTEEALHYFAKYYGRVVKPNIVRAIVGNTCNLKCVMCPYHSSVIKPTHATAFFQGNRAMSWDMMKRLARDCGALESSVSIGTIEEPLLHPDIYLFIRHCREEGVPQVHVTTNGQLLNQERSRLLLEAGITSLDVSLDAIDAETYYQIRGSDFHRVESNIDNFLKLRDRLKIPCNVRTSLVRNPEISLEAEAKFIQKWLAKVDSVFVLNLAKYQGGNMRLSQKNQQVETLIKNYLQQSGDRWPCTFPFTEIAILPDGRVYYCVETLFRLGFDEAETMGNYCSQNLSEIWQGEVFQRFRQDLILNQLQKRPCQNCEMWRSQVLSHSDQEGIRETATEVTKVYTKIVG